MPEPNARRTWVAAYLGLQAAAGAAWWLVLLAAPESRARFRVSDAPDSTVLGFWLADLTLFVGGSAACAYAVARGHRWTRALLWLTTGAVSYAALTCAGLTIVTADAWLATAFMLPAMVAMLVILWSRPWESSGSSNARSVRPARPPRPGSC